LSDDRPYKVLGPGRIQLTPTAREFARDYGWSEEQMAKHLLREHQKRESGLLQKEGED
jgi:acetyl-CoA acetyltransferase